MECVFCGLHIYIYFISFWFIFHFLLYIYILECATVHLWSITHSHLVGRFEFYVDLKLCRNTNKSLSDYILLLYVDLKMSAMWILEIFSGVM